MAELSRLQVKISSEEEAWGSVGFGASDYSVPITATDLDIRDLTSTDVVTVTGGAGQTADIKITLDSESVALNNDSLVGPGDPVIDSYTHTPINLAAGANQVLVSSAPNKQIWVYGIGFLLNVAGTVSFQDEDDLAITGVMPFATNSGMGIPPSGNFSMPIWKLGTDKDLEVDLVGVECDGFLTYALVSV